MKLKTGDFILTGIILAAALMVGSFFLTSEADASTAVVIKDGQVIKRIDLENIDQSVSFEINDKYYDLIVAEKGRIRFKEADCPDRVCVNTGWITRPGQISVCLPNGIIVKIEGSDDEIDTILR